MEATTAPFRRSMSRHATNLVALMTLFVALAPPTSAQFNGTGLATFYTSPEVNLCQQRGLNPEDPNDQLVALAAGLPLASFPATPTTTFNKCFVCLAVRCLELFGSSPDNSCPTQDTVLVKVQDQCDDPRCNGLASQGTYNLDFADYTFRRVFGSNVPNGGPGEGRVEWRVVDCGWISTSITVRLVNLEPFFVRFTFQRVAGVPGRVTRAFVRPQGGGFVELIDSSLLNAGVEGDQDAVFWIANPTGQPFDGPYDLRLEQGAQVIECQDCVGAAVGSYQTPQCFQFTPNAIIGCEGHGGAPADQPTPPVEAPPTEPPTPPTEQPTPPTEPPTPPTEQPTPPTEPPTPPTTPTSPIEPPTTPTPPTEPPTEPPTPPTAPPSTPDIVLPLFAQCGGLGGDCPFASTSPRLCTPGRYAGVACEADSVCVAQSVFYSQCVANGPPAPVNEAPLPPAGVTELPGYSTCGGSTSTCPLPREQCVDAPYPGTTCAPFFRCAKVNPTFFQCVLREDIPLV